MSDKNSQIFFNFTTIKYLKDAETYSATVQGIKIKVQKSSEISIIVAYGVKCPHMGLLHLMPNGIILEFDNSIDVLKNALTRVSGSKMLQSEWEINKCPISKLISKTFTIPNGTG